MRTASGRSSMTTEIGPSRRSCDSPTSSPNTCSIRRRARGPEPRSSTASSSRFSRSRIGSAASSQRLRIGPRRPTERCRPNPSAADRRPTRAPGNVPPWTATRKKERVDPWIVRVHPVSRCKSGSLCHRRLSHFSSKAVLRVSRESGRSSRRRGSARCPGRRGRVVLARPLSKRAASVRPMDEAATSAAGTPSTLERRTNMTSTLSRIGVPPVLGRSTRKVAAR